jgi:hypothetical protein
MEQWHRKYLGAGGQVYQSLRELRDLRYRLDKLVTQERCWIVAADLDTAEVSVYFPPGNGVMTVACNAIPSLPPPTDPQGIYLLSKETLPVVAIAYDEDVHEPLAPTFQKDI